MMMNWWIVLWYGWPTKGVEPYFMPGPLSKILTIANLRHAASRVWICTEPEFRLSWMKLCSSDNHYITAPPLFPLIISSSVYQLLLNSAHAWITSILNISLNSPVSSILNSWMNLVTRGLLKIDQLFPWPCFFFIYNNFR